MEEHEREKIFEAIRKIKNSVHYLGDVELIRGVENLREAVYHPHNKD